MKKIIVIIWLVFLFTGILSMFWYAKWTDQLPTPVPDDYTPVLTGEYIALQMNFKSEDKALSLSTVRCMIDY